MSQQGKIMMLLFAAVIVLGVMQFNSCENNKKYQKSEIEIAKAKEREKELVKRITEVIKGRNKSQLEKDSVLKIIADRDKSEAAIKQKYDKKKNNIRTLDADASILFFSGKVSEKSHN